MNPLNAITMDLIGTLIKFSELPHLVYQRVAKGFCVYVEDSHLLEKSLLKAISYHRDVQPNFGSNTDGNIGDSTQWWFQVVHSTFRGALGQFYHEGKVDLIAKHLCELYASASCYEVYTDARQFLIDVRCKYPHVKLAVVSNSDKNIEKILNQLKLGRYLDAIVSAESFGASKPDPKIFLEVLKELQIDSSSGGIVHIGDDIQRDYLGAKNLGWNSILLRRNASKDVTEEDVEEVCENFDEVFKKLF